MENKYFIPLNYRDGGTALNGMATKRNIAEGIVLALAGILLVRLLPIPSDSRLTAYVFVGGFGFFAGVVGVSGDPLSVFVRDAFNWTKRKRPCIYNNHGEAFTTTAADLMLSQPQFRDKLADAIDKFRLSMAAKQIDYIEGETFQFAEDPELLALKEADEKAKVKKEAQLAAEAESQQEENNAEPVQPEPETNVTELDIGQMLENIVLQDDEGDINA